MKKRRIFYLISGFGILIIVTIFLIYKSMFGVTIKPNGIKSIIFIPTGSAYSQVKDSLNIHLLIKKPAVLEWVAARKKYPDLIKPGRYVIDNGISTVGLINLLRSGRQTPVKLTFNNIRNLNQLAGRIGTQLEVDSAQILSFLLDENNYKADGFTKENIIALFIPNTYEIYWNTNPEKLYSRMVKEYKLFWNDDRMAKATEKRLKPIEVAILASIIDDEVSRQPEKPKIAGVYLNRLRQGMPLQACPTIKFALSDFTITRVLKIHLLVDSPYNTYKHYGFPPGPIGCPTIEGIDAVLNAEKHDFLFFAAKADFSGFHNFSRTLSEHNRYAALYQKELDMRKIFK
jgi:UPF0755 protein